MQKININISGNYLLIFQGTIYCYVIILDLDRGNEMVSRSHGLVHNYSFYWTLWFW
jgi:hypothetical protein